MDCCGSRAVSVCVWFAFSRSGVSLNAGSLLTSLPAIVARCLSAMLANLSRSARGTAYQRMRP